MSQHERHAPDKAGAHKNLPILPMSVLDQEADLYADRMLGSDSREGADAFRRFVREYPARAEEARAAYRDSFCAVMAGHFLIVPDDEVDRAREAVRVGAL